MRFICTTYDSEGDTNEHVFNLELENMLSLDPPVWLVAMGGIDSPLLAGLPLTADCMNVSLIAAMGNALVAQSQPLIWAPQNLVVRRSG